MIGGIGTSATAFGMGAARANGRFDLAGTLASEMLGASWPLPGGTLMMPRLFSNAAHAPLLGEAAIVFQLSQEPHSAAKEVVGREIPFCVYGMLAVYFLGGYVLTRRGWALVFVRSKVM